MILLEEPIYTPQGILYPGAIKILRKAGTRYVITKDNLTAYAYKQQLRFLRNK